MDRMFVQQCRMSWSPTVALHAQHEGKLHSVGEGQAWVTFEKEKVVGSLLLWQPRALWYCPISLTQMSLQSQRMRVWRHGNLHAQNNQAVSPQNCSHHPVTCALVANQGFPLVLESSKVWHHSPTLFQREREKFRKYSRKNRLSCGLKSVQLC